MNIDERIEALTVNQLQTTKDIQALQRIAQQDGENIRVLAGIAEIHERRLTTLEGDDQ